mmetsp:Transcript_29455/g.29073  ORF Transcript_29455/g.29073 Transcript_29455/m.29073 type:complete len:124 (-) Transcript_29455:582-953(-)
MRKISNRFSPGIPDIGSPTEAPKAESREKSKPIYTPKGNTKNLMKQSLERINKAIKRYGKNIGPENFPGPFELVRNPSTPSQARENLESQESSLLGSVIILDNPKVQLSTNKAFSQNATGSIV